MQTSELMVNNIKVENQCKEAQNLCVLKKMWSSHISIQNKYISKEDVTFQIITELEVLTLGSDHRVHLDWTPNPCYSMECLKLVSIPENWTHSLWPNTTLEI